MPEGDIELPKDNWMPPTWAKPIDSGIPEWKSNSGMLEPGNVDLYKQPKVKNPDGSTSTVDSSSYNIDGKEVLLPSVTPDGRHLQTPEEIIDEYKKTGRHLGKFQTPQGANLYAEKLHNDYAAGKYDWKPPDFATPIKSKEQPTDENSGLLNTLYHHIVQPPEFITKPAHEFSDWITTPRLHEDPLLTMYKGMLGGMVEGIAGQASPANAAMTAFPESRPINAGIGALQGAHGISEISKGNYGSGAADLAFSLLGLRSLRGEKPNIEMPPVPEKQKPTGPPNKWPIWPDMQGEPAWEPKIKGLLPERSSYPNFIAGEAGVAENRPYKIDTGPIRPKIAGEEATVLPQEYGEITEIPPDLAARRGLEVGQPQTEEPLIAPENNQKLQDLAKKQAWEDKTKIQWDSMSENEKLSEMAGHAPGMQSFKEKFDPLSELGSMPPERLINNLIDVVDKHGADWPSVLKTFNDHFPNKFTEFLSSEKGEFNWAKMDWNKIKEMGTGLDPKVQRPVNANNVKYEQATAKLVDALKSATDLRPEQEALYSEALGEKSALLNKIKTPGLAGFSERARAMQGELPKVDFAKVKIAPKTVDTLMDAIVDNPRLLPFEKFRSQIALVKTLNGSLPQRNEIALLSNTFGDDFGSVVEMHGGLGLPLKITAEGANLMKSYMASADMSAPLRQGLALIGTKEYWRAFGSMVFGQAVSPEVYRAVQQSLIERPNYLLGREAGLYLSGHTHLTEREEQFMSHIAETGSFLPKGVQPLYRATIGKVQQFSEHAYTGFLNKLRADTFDRMVKSAKDMGYDVSQGAPAVKEIAKFVNNATGRGDLGRFNKYAGDLNTLFFSPRLIASRVKLATMAVDPKTYTTLNPVVRKEYLKSLVSMGTFGSMVLGLGSLAGGTVSTDPLSADFGKLRIGNARMDPWGGLQQYAVGAMRFAAGKTDSPFKTGPFAPTRWGIAENFAANKLSPAAALAYHFMTAKQDAKGNWKDRYNQPYDIRTDIAKSYIPLVVQDLYSLYKDDPDLMPIGAFAFFGGGVQDYPDRVKKQQGRFGLMKVR